jgi:hypothetical protein
MALAVSLLIFRCIEPKSIGSKTSVLPHPVSAVSTTSNTVHNISGASSHAPKSRTSLVISHGQKMTHSCASPRLDIYPLVLINGLNLQIKS